MKKKYLLLLLLPVCTCIRGQQFSVAEYRKTHEAEILREFVSLLSIPNVAADTLHLRESASFIMQMMQQRGIQGVRLLNGTTAGTPPAVYGEWQTPGASKTLVFYAHYDGQPVNPAQWFAGLSPFQPRWSKGILGLGGEFIEPGATGPFDPDWRIYARGASDDKGGVAAILNAFSAIRAGGGMPGCNLKFFFEGEEEAGSSHLGEILDANRSLLQADLWIICDGPVHQSGRKQVVFGVRGDTHLELTVYASRRPLHSGHYGNWAPNPALELAKLLASMKDDKGRVRVKGFYDDVKPFTATERKALAAIPPVDELLKKELGISAPEQSGISLAEAILQPSLNINGMQSGNVGKMASNQIPTTAEAVLDLRLVPGNDWQRQQQKVIDHIRRQGFFVTNHEPTDGERQRYGRIVRVITGKNSYNAQRTPLDLPIARQVVAAVQSVSQEQVIEMPSLGGSLPLFLFEQHLGARTITVPIANYDNNQHAENENIRLGHFWSGIETMAALMRMK